MELFLLHFGVLPKSIKINGMEKGDEVNRKTKRILIIVLTLHFLIFASFTYPQKRTEAFAFAIPPVAGAIAIGAVALGAGLTLLGDEDSGADISGFGKDLWNGTTQVMKDSINSIAKWLPGGRTMDAPSLQLDLKDLTLDAQDYIRNSSSKTLTNQYTKNNSFAINNYPAMTSAKISGDVRSFVTNTSDVFYVKNRSGVSYLVKNLELGVYSSSWGLTATNYLRLGEMTSYNTGSTSMGVGLDYSQNNQAYRDAATVLGNGDADLFVDSLLPSLSNDNTIVRLISGATATALISNTPASRVTEQWEEMLDAGLVIDGSSILEANPDVQWDGSNDTFIDGTGNPVATGDLVMPQPRVYDRDGTKVIGFPTVGGGAKAIDGTDIVAPTTGEGGGTGTGELTADGTGIIGAIKGLWDFLKGILQKILDAILSLAELVGLMALIDLISQVLSKIGAMALNLADLLGLMAVFDWLSDILSAILSIASYLNPFSENFFLYIALIPSAGYFQNYFDDIFSIYSDKIPIIAQLKDFFTSIKNVNYNDGTPAFEINLPPDLGGKTVPLIDFGFFADYRTLIINFIRFTAWFIFLKRLYKRIPRVVYR